MTPGVLFHVPVEVAGPTGAVAATRYAGGTASGAPVTGSFLKGDFIIDQAGKVWVCTTAGSPGTWADVGGGGGGVSSINKTGSTALTGAVTLTGGTNVTLTQSGQDISIAASGGGGGVTEYDYVENTSSTITCSGALPSTADAIIDGNAVTYDGSTRIKIEFGCYSMNNGGVIELYDGSTDLGRLGFGNGGLCFYASRILTPSAASHTFHIKGWRTTGSNLTIDSGSGGTGAVLPAWYRITKA